MVNWFHDMKMNDLEQMHVLEKHTYGHLLYYQLIYPLATSFVICDVNQYNLLKLYNNY